MIDIILASNNAHKVKEFSAIFGSSFKFQTLESAGFTEDIVEDGDTFIDNSLIKCRAVYEKLKMPVLADDSGLCVKALGGDPGIYSARFGGPGLSDKDRYLLLLDKLKEIPEEKRILDASFVCALSLYFSPTRMYVIQEEVAGLITFEPAGEKGFGYDPIFYIPEFGKTAAQLSEKQKNKISHRGKAAAVMQRILESSV